MFNNLSTSRLAPEGRVGTEGSIRNGANWIKLKVGGYSWNPSQRVYGYRLGLGRIKSIGVTPGSKGWSCGMGRGEQALCFLFREVIWLISSSINCVRLRFVFGVSGCVERFLCPGGVLFLGVWEGAGGSFCRLHQSFHSL